MTMRAYDLMDSVLDRSVILGYTKIGPALRRLWWPADPPSDAMAGRTVLVTGATSGLGRATAARLGRLGATVHVHGRSPEKVDETIGQLRSAVPGADFRPELCDLSDLDDVRRFGTDLSQRMPALDALIHNAGVMAPDRRETPQGHELTLAVMVLSTHLLNQLLSDSLAAADSPAMVVFMSSGGMYAAGLHDEDPEYSAGSYSASTAYARCKRMQVVLAQMWSERLGSLGIEVASTHPGWVDTEGVAESMPRFRAVMRPLLRSPESGADTAAWLVATRPTAAGTTRFWHDRRLRPTSFGPARDQSPQRRERLWDYVAAATDTPAWNDHDADRGQA